MIIPNGGMQNGEERERKYLKFFLPFKGSMKCSEWNLYLPFVDPFGITFYRILGFLDAKKL